MKKKCVYVGGFCPPCNFLREILSGVIFSGGGGGKIICPGGGGDYVRTPCHKHGGFGQISATRV